MRRDNETSLLSGVDERTVLLDHCHAVVQIPESVTTNPTPRITHRFTPDIILEIAKFLSDPAKNPSTIGELWGLMQIGDPLGNLRYLGSSRSYLSKEELESTSKIMWDEKEQYYFFRGEPSIRLMKDKKGRFYRFLNVLYPDLGLFIYRQLIIRDSISPALPALRNLLTKNFKVSADSITLRNSYPILIEERLTIPKPPFVDLQLQPGRSVLTSESCLVLSGLFAKNPLHYVTYPSLAVTHWMSLVFLSITMTFVSLFLFLPRDLWFMTNTMVDKDGFCEEFTSCNSCRCDTLGSAACASIASDLQISVALFAKICDLYQSSYCPQGSFTHQGYSAPPDVWNISQSVVNWYASTPIVSCSNANQIGTVIGIVLFGLITLIAFCVERVTASKYPRVNADGDMSSSDLKKIRDVADALRHNALPKRNTVFDERSVAPIRSAAAAASAGPAVSR